MGRVGKMEELQNLAVFLISGGCDWINGETIAMDGGRRWPPAAISISCATGQCFPAPIYPNKNPATFRFWISSLPSVMR